MNASKLTKACSILAFLLLLTINAIAQEVWIANRLFPGQVIKDGGQIWVELVPFAQALQVSSAIDGTNATIDGQPLPSQVKGGAVLVPLKEAAAITGAIIRDNKSMGIIDVFKGIKEQDPSALAATASDPSTSEANTIKTAAFTLTLPEGMQMSRDAKTLQSFGFKATQSSGQFNKKYGGDGNSTAITFDGILFHKGDTKYKRGFGAVAFTPLAPNTKKSLSPSQIPAALNLGLQLVAQEFGMIPSGPIHEQLIGGQSFSMLDGLIPSKGLQMTMLMRIDLNTNRQYLLMSMVPGVSPNDAADFMNIFESIQTH